MGGGGSPTKKSVYWYMSGHDGGFPSFGRATLFQELPPRAPGALGLVFFDNEGSGDALMEQKGHRSRVLESRASRLRIGSL